jgi:hypothetical protein
MDLNTAKDVLVQTHLAAISDNHRAGTMYLESGPGIGKSSAGGYQYARDLARIINKPVGLIIPNVVAWVSVDANGFMLPARGEENRLDTVFSTPPWFPTKFTIWVVEPSGVWHRPGTWKHAIPEVGIVFFDEFAQAEEEVQKSLANVLLEGRMRDVELPLHWRVMAAGNRTKDRSGVMRKLMFLVNRWCELYIDASCPAWIKWAGLLPDEERPHYLTVSFAKKNPHLVFLDEVPAETGPFCTPRSLCATDRDLKALRTPEDVRHNRMPTTDVAREVARGRIGEGNAAQLMVHFRFADALPDIEDIEHDPRTAKLPTTLDAQMIIAHFLAHHLNEDNVSNIMKYISRMTPEMGVLAVSTIKADANRFKVAAPCPEFQKWLIAHQDLLIAAAA